MANEAVIIELLGNKGDPVRYTVANATGIEKGAILRLVDPRTAIASLGLSQVPAGIAAEEKVASDGATAISCYTNGIFDLTLDANATCNAGDMLVMSGTNFVAQASKYIVSTDDVYLSGMILGRALETGSAGEVIAVRVNL